MVSLARIPVIVKLPPLLDINAATPNICHPPKPHISYTLLDEVILTVVFYPSYDSLMHSR